MSTFLIKYQTEKSITSVPGVMILTSKYRYKRILSEISRKSLPSWCNVSTSDNGKLLLSVLELFNLGTK